MLIKCRQCQNDLTKDNFALFHNKRNKTCKDCRYKNNEWYSKDLNGKRTKAKEYYYKNFSKIKDYRFKQAIKRKYGLSLDEYNQMLSAQKNKCLLCEIEFSKEKGIRDKTPQVDHCHKTNRIRGLLCKTCNMLVIPAVEKFNHLIPKAESYLKLKR